MALTNPQIHALLLEQKYDEIIINLQDFARFICKDVYSRFVYSHQQRQDIYSEALYKLTDVIRRIPPNHESPNYLAYLRTCIHKHIRSWLYKDHLIAIPAESFRSLAKRDPDLTFVPVIQDLPSEAMGSGEFADSNLSYTEEQHPLDVEDMFSWMRLDSMQLTIITLRMRGMKLREIAPVVKLSFQRVSQILEIIQESCKQYFQVQETHLRVK